MTEPLLDVDSLAAGYGEVLAVRDVSLHIGEGEIVALLGPNGAGKSTTLLALGGVLPLSSGTVRYRGRELQGPLHQRARAGIALVTERRATITTLTVAANLSLGLGNRDEAFELFPELRPLAGRRAGLLSGGEQQILTVGRALSWSPRLLLVDELSLGLAPQIVRRLLDRIRCAAGEGMGVLLVEQHAREALRLADRAYVIRGGEIRLEGTGADLLTRFDELERVYLSNEGLDVTTRPDPVGGT